MVKTIFKAPPRQLGRSSHLTSVLFLSKKDWVHHPKHSKTIKTSQLWPPNTSQTTSPASLRPCVPGGRAMRCARMLLSFRALWVVAEAERLDGHWWRGEPLGAPKKCGKPIAYRNPCDLEQNFHRISMYIYFPNALISINWGILVYHGIPHLWTNPLKPIELNF